MKYCLPALILLTLVLSSCANVPATVEDNIPIESEPEQSPQENASTETNSENPTEIVGEDEESLQRFIREWDLPVSMDGKYPAITYFKNHAPEAIPYDLPAPNNVRLVGGVMGSWVEYLLIFKTSLSPQVAHKFYAQALKERGWMASPANEGGALIANPDSDFYRTYCYGDNEASLGVETRSLSIRRTMIRLYLDTSPSMPCNSDDNS